MQHKSRSLLWALACLLVLFGPGPSFGQSTNALVNGQVLDSSGAIVPDALVQIISDTTHITYEGHTNREGVYSVANLPPGSYHIQVSKTGFKTIIRPDIVLNVQDAKAINFTLPVGAVTETVTVEGGASLINTESATVSTVVDRQFVENLPLNGRSFQTLIELSPGVTLTPSNIYDTGQFSVNGQRTDANYFTVDGVSANMAATVAYGLNQSASGLDVGYSALGGTNSLVSVDAMQEFRIQTSTFAPEFGRAPGGQISIVTRSGTNQFHGTAFDYFRNEALDAATWFVGRDRLTKPAERQNDFGGVFGGPIIKDRTFFFVSYEGLRLKQPQTAEESVPDATTRASAPNAIIGDMLNAFPTPSPSAPELGGGLAQENASFANPSRLDSFGIRVDHTINSRFTLFGRYSYSPSEVDSRGAYGGYGDDLADYQIAKITTHTFTLGLTTSISPTVSNEFRANLSNSRSAQIYNMDNYGGAVPITVGLLKTIGFPSNSTLTNSEFEFLSFTGQYWVWGVNNINEQRQLNFVDNVSWSVRTHQLKFGVDYRWLAPFAAGLSYAQAAEFTDFSNTSGGVLSGVPAAMAVATLQGAPFLVKNFSLYGQDTWKATPRLSVTYGLRWDVNPPLTGKKFQNDPYTANGIDNPSTMTLAPRGTPFYATTWGNVAPRIGAAFKLRQAPGHETVLRGGFGVFYDTGGGNLGEATVRFPYDALKVLTGVPFPLSPSDAAPAPFTFTPPVESGFYITEPNLKLPRTYEMNFAVEQSLGLSQTVSVTYVGAVGRNLLRAYYLNAPSPDFAGEVNITGNTGTSDYNSLQLKYQRRLSHGLQALASYTYSHSLDNGSDDSDYLTPVGAANPNVDRGASDFDIRHQFSTALTYDVPTFGKQGWVRGFTKDWSAEAFMVARSSAPVNVSSFSQIDTYLINGRPNLVPGQPLVLYGPQYPGGKALNPAAFASAGSAIQGDLSRNYFRGFPAWQTDMAIHRQFHLTEKVGLQFRAEAFNIFNHPNFAPMDSYFGDPLFGQSTTTLASSLGGLSALYQIGGPRSLQLALKLTF
jgi:hypothetical protein